ncbi:hypothetical protein SPFM12_00057 [Salmonella phage SPFM12]|nr:hypothetical protein SPFM12_00057 [Salmonella phage SPFM12]
MSKDEGKFLRSALERLAGGSVQYQSASTLVQSYFASYANSNAIQALLTTEKRPYVINPNWDISKTNPGMVELKLYIEPGVGYSTYGQRLLTLFNAPGQGAEIADTVIQNLLMNLNVQAAAAGNLNSVEYYLPKLQPMIQAITDPIAQQALYGELMTLIYGMSTKLNQYGLPNRIDLDSFTGGSGNFSSLDINTSSVTHTFDSFKDLDDFLSIDGISNYVDMANSAKWQVTALIDDATMNIAGQLAKLPGEVQREIGDSALSAVGTDYASVKARLEFSPGGAGSLLSKGWDTLTDLRDVSEPFQKVNQEGKTALSYRVPTFASNTKEALPVIDPQKLTVGGKKAAGSAASGVSPPQPNIGNTISEKFGNVFGGGDQGAQNLYNNATAKAGETFDKIFNDVQNRVQSTIGNAERGIENNLDGITNQISSTTGAIENKVRSATTFR